MNYECGFYRENGSARAPIAVAKELDTARVDTESKAAQKERIRRIVSQIAADTEVCFDEKAPGIIFIVRLAKSGLILTPAIRWGIEEVSALSDHSVRLLIEQSTDEVAWVASQMTRSALEEKSGWNSPDEQWCWAK